MIPRTTIGLLDRIKSDIHLTKYDVHCAIVDYTSGKANADLTILKCRQALSWSERAVGTINEAIRKIEQKGSVK